MSSGHRIGDAPAPGPIVRMIQREPGLRYFLGRWPDVSRKFLVPYGAGRAMDGDVTYVDEGVPVRFKMGVEPDRYVAGHEGFEWWLMTRKGMKYWVGPGAASAHWWATGYEHYLLRLDGWSDDDIVAYEKEWLTYISEDEAGRLSPETVPPDLYTGPYEPGMDNDAGEDAMDQKILPILRAARARMLQVQEARLMA
jgi:hypothetical protein